MKILNAQDIKKADKATIKNEPIRSIDLMERASLECYHWILDQSYNFYNTIHIFCGMGNNGGDGLALARHLSLNDYSVRVYIVHFSKNMSDDFITNYRRAEECHLPIENIHSKEDFPVIKKEELVIDAIFGIGLSKAPKGFTKELLQHINASSAVVYAIDVPSGLFIDKPIQDKDSVIKASWVLTFQTPKLAYLLPDNQEFVENFSVLDIGLDQAFIDDLSTPYYYTTVEDVMPLLEPRKRFSHKGSFGHSLIIGGSFGKIGAAVLAAKAALKAGSGLVTAYIPKCGYNILQTAVPEVMVEVDSENEITFFNFRTQPSVIGLGVGLGTSEKTARGLGKFLKQNKLPLVLDADALNIISKNPEYLDYLPENTLLTPHPGELERLLGSWKNDYEKLDKIKDFSIRYRCIIVLKGAHTVVVQNDRFYFNSSGNPALATAGTGDVLMGIITGLLAQSYTALEAAILGVYLHGKAADIITQIENTEETLLASDILNALPGAFAYVIRGGVENDKYEDLDKEPFDDFFDDDNDSPF